jgi:hypothetical protein
VEISNLFVLSAYFPPPSVFRFSKKDKLPHLALRQIFPPKASGQCWSPCGFKQRLHPAVIFYLGIHPVPTAEAHLPSPKIFGRNCAARRLFSSQRNHFGNVLQTRFAVFKMGGKR